VFAIHVDSGTATSIAEEFERIAPDARNVHYIDRHHPIWGGWGVAETELRLTRSLLELDGDWTHFVNLSGACYPLQSRATIDAFLSAHPHRNFIEVNKIRPDESYVRERVSWVHREVDGRIKKTSIPKVVTSSLDVEWGGSNWHILTREFCEWVMSDPVAAKILEYVRDIGVPDEHFMQCLIMASPFADSVVPYAREIKWRDEAFHPETLTSTDSKLLLESKMLFARKFDAGVDSRILVDLAGKIGAPAGRTLVT
jgi:hypothetical protein